MLVVLLVLLVLAVRKKENKSVLFHIAIDIIRKKQFCYIKNE